MQFRKAQKNAKKSFSRIKTDQNLIFRLQFSFEIWFVENFSIHNLTRCKSCDSISHLLRFFFKRKSDML